MNSILISIQPKWCELIASGAKTIEVRKTAPKEVPFKAYIYCTYGRNKNQKLYIDAFGNISVKANSTKWINGKVIGEFICNRVDKYEYTSCGYGESISEKDFNKTGITRSEFYDYGKLKTLYGLHITDLKIYETPKELAEFSYAALECCFGAKYGKYCVNRLKKFCKYENNFICNNKITHAPQSWCRIQNPDIELFDCKKFAEYKPLTTEQLAFEHNLTIFEKVWIAAYANITYKKDEIKISVYNKSGRLKSKKFKTIKDACKWAMTEAEVAK